MITVRTSPQYVNRVRQDWTANGGVYGDGGVYAIAPSNDPFAQLGPTLDLTFAGIPTDQFTAATTDGYSINLNLSSEIYQIAAEYVVWSDYQVRYSLLPNALINAALNIEPEKSLFKDTLIGGRPLGDINNDGSVTSADATAYTRFNGSFWLNTADRNDYIRTVLNPYMLANPGLYAAYLSPGPLAAKTFADVITFTRASTGTYFDSAGVLQSAANDQPRFDYNPSTLAARGLLIEESRTNLLTYSEAFDTVSDWTPTRTSVTANAASAPDGNTTADALVIDTTPLTNHSIGQSESVTSGTTYTLSVFAKANQITQINLRFNAQFPAGNTFFDLSAGTLANNGTVVASSITPVGNGWYRCTFTQTANATGIAVAQIFLAVANAITITTANGTDNVLLWGAQLEAGAFPTSYIPTTTTALPRSADDARVNTLSPWYNQSAGTLFVERIRGPLDAIAARRYVNISDGSAGTNVAFQKIQGATGGSSAVSYVAGVADFAPNPAGVSADGAIVKTALAIDNTGKAMSRDGGTVATSAVLPALSGMTTMFIGGNGNLSGNCDTWIRRITYYPRRLANADLQTITT